MDHKQSEREAQRDQINRDEMIERLSHALPEDGFSEPLSGLRITRVSSPSGPVCGSSIPSFCIIAQGRKEVSVGEKSYYYDPSTFLLPTVALPIVSRVLDGSKAQPYLGIRLNIEPMIVGSIMIEMGQLSAGTQDGAKAIAVSTLDSTLLDAVTRLIRLVDSPVEARLLQPLVTREIVCHLLMGEQGDRLRHMTVPSAHTHRIAQAVEKIFREFNKPLHVEEMAKQIGMSVSGFHHHFKAVTALSPLQFQKQLRLREAQRLMLNEEFDAASAGYRVGYDDASHFSREYKRFFGVPPMRDVERLREALEVNSDF
ncbi:AraC family transcriptional regulator [bacterium]|nr:MAG: AraC family transcriptional regulator [bacterium]